MDHVICTDSSSTSPYELLLKALSLIPLPHYFFFILFVFLNFLYNFFEIHFFRDLVAGFRGHPVHLTYCVSSKLYQSVAAKCHVLHRRYLPTPWLSSPHLQTAFLSIFGRAPDITYKRLLFQTPDGGTIALDWLTYSDVIEGSTNVNDGILNSDKNPIVVVIPGLTSDSDSSYLKHLAFKMARHGWNVVVINHRGLGGISLTSDCIYNGGRTEDLRRVIDHIHGQYPEAPLYAVGTSIGANILIKYLGEDGINTPIVGAVAVCSPWDILMCGRFITRRLVQKFYDIVLRIGLQRYAQSHKSILAHLVNWEAIETARSVRDVDNHFTRVLGKFETVDAYYRHSSCIHFLGNVSVPLLCISALDDPVCTREAIPWDECRANENIILATTQHGGHLAFYEGLTAKSLWWVRAVNVFLDVLNTSPFAKRGKVQESSLVTAVESSVDRAPYINIAENGMVAAVGSMASDNVIEDTPSEPVAQMKKDGETHVDREKTDSMTLPGIDFIQPYVFVPIRRHMNQLSRRSRISIWLLACIAITTTWPLVDSALILFFKRKFRSFRPKAMLRRNKTF